MWRSGSASDMLVSWVQQAGFYPPLLVLAVQGNRFITDWIADTGWFTPNQISAGHTALIRHFCCGFASDADRFDGVTLYDGVGVTGGPMLAESIAYLDVEVIGLLFGYDHRCPSHEDFHCDDHININKYYN